MNQIYLVCTRSAISASALTYIINQSPQFYNVVHKNLWLDEAGSKFKDATVIEDWWNIPKTFANFYNHDVRNNENIKLRCKTYAIVGIHCPQAKTLHYLHTLQTHRTL